MAHVLELTVKDASGTNRDIATLDALISQGFSATATFTPGASSHAAPSSIATAQQFTFSPAPPSGTIIRLTDVELEIDSATVQATAWKLALYGVTPPSAYADAAAWDLPSGDRASFKGFIDIGTAIDLGSTQWVERQGVDKKVLLTGTTLFAYLLPLTTLTTVAVAHIVKLYGEPV